MMFLHWRHIFNRADKANPFIVLFILFLLTNTVYQLMKSSFR